MQMSLYPQNPPSPTKQLSFADLDPTQSVRQPGSQPDGEILDRLLDWFQIEVAEGDASPHTICSYLSSIRGYMSWCNQRQVDPIAASEEHIKLYRAFLVNDGYKRGTIATKLAGVRRYYDAVLDWGYRPDNPASKVKAKRNLTSRSDQVMGKYIPDREKFINLYALPSSRTILGKRDRAILRLLCYTGIRVSEISALDVRDLDLGEKPQLTIRAGKGFKKRYAPLGHKDRITLEEWLLDRNNVANTDCQSVFVTLDNRTRGQRLGTRGIRSIVDKYLRQDGIKKPGRSCHALRHSLATWLLDAGVPIEAIADLLGHSSVAITAIYAKIVDRRKYTPSEILSSKISASSAETLTDKALIRSEPNSIQIIPEGISSITHR